MKPKKPIGPCYRVRTVNRRFPDPPLTLVTICPKMDMFSSPPALSDKPLGFLPRKLSHKLSVQGGWPVGLDNI